MADVSKIKLPNNNEYNIKDARIPSVSSSDNGKVLQVSSGEWAVVSLSGSNTIVSISTSENGTAVFEWSNGDTTTVDFNHDHPQYPNYYSGTTDPSDSVGEDGDIYLKLTS